MEEALQHEEAPQCIGLQTTSAGNHHPNGSKANDALTIKMYQSNEAAQALSEWRDVLEGQLSHAPDADPIRIHPKIAETYQARVQELISGLNKTREMHEAQDALRSLVDKIVLQPLPETGKLDIVLEGALSGLLTLAIGSKRKKGLSVKTQAIDNIE